ncbi:hypothetical protein ACFL08_01245 [Patescibacteria group bacterium]
MTIDRKNTTIISLGGSLIVPDDIDNNFLTSFKELICEKIEEGHRFILVTKGN